MTSGGLAHPVMTVWRIRLRPELPPAGNHNRLVEKAVTSYNQQ
jgi:hypothetical protein